MKLHPDSTVDLPTALPLPSAVEVAPCVFPQTLAARIPVMVKDLAAVVPDMQPQHLGVKPKQAEAIMYQTAKPETALNPMKPPGLKK